MPKKTEKIMEIELMEKCTYCSATLDDDQFMYCSSECAHDDYISEISSYYHHVQELIDNKDAHVKILI